MIRMIKKIPVAAVIFLCLIFGLQSISIAAPWQDEQERISMQIHVNKVKIESPKRYQEMINKAGTIVNCLSCHADIFPRIKQPAGK